MPDISMCANPDCPLAPDCYRHEKSGTKPGDWQRQAWMQFTWQENDAGVPHCASFMPVRPKMDKCDEWDFSPKRREDASGAPDPETWIEVKETGDPLWKLNRGWWGHLGLRITDTKIGPDGRTIFIKVGK